MSKHSLPNRQPDASHHDPRPATGAQRQAKLRATGRQIACVLRDPVALDALARLEREHGGVTAAVTFALARSKR